MTVFISYCREDERIASKLYRDLAENGIECWFDKTSLVPGQRWQDTIDSAIKKSRFFLALLSSNSVGKRGYVQKELALALDVLDEFPETEIFVVPVRVNDCSPSHRRIQNLHWLDLFPSYKVGILKLVKLFGGESAERKTPPLTTTTSSRSTGQLTHRETEVLCRLGWRNEKIASDLGGLSYHTVISHVSRIFRKLNVHSRSEALSVAIAQGIIKAKDLKR